MSRIIFVGNPEFAVGVLDEINKRNIEIASVITQKDKKRSRGKIKPSPVKEYAEENNLNLFCTDNINSDESIEYIKSVKADYIIVVAYGQKIGKDLLDLFKDRIINVHASILPKYRGASPINYALLNGDDETGVSIMLINQGMDTGDILKICKIKINNEHNYINLSKDLSKLGGVCLADVIDYFDKFYNEREKQDDEKASYTGLIDKSMGKIDFNKNADEIFNKWRAFYSWPKLFAIYKSDIIKIHEFKIIEKFDETEPGKIIKSDNEGIYVNCKDKCILITEVQFPGKKKTRVSEYLKGNKIEEIKFS